MCAAEVEYQSPEAAHAGGAGPERLEQYMRYAVCIAELFDAICQRLKDHTLPVEADPETHDAQRERECGEKN